MLLRFQMLIHGTFGQAGSTYFAWNYFLACLFLALVVSLAASGLDTFSVTFVVGHIS
jgi:hypothetical protein